MHARARIVAVRDDCGRTRLRELVGDGPLTVRPTSRPGRTRVHLVAGAFGPLGGDVLTLEIVVGPGALLDVAGVAAAVAQRSRDSQPSELRVQIEVAETARLVLALPPTVVTAGARHTIDTRITIAAGGQLVLREETIRGRTREAGGEAVLRTQLDVARRPILRQEFELCGEVGGPWRPRAVGSLLLVGVAKTFARQPPADSGVRAAWLNLPKDAGHLLAALSDDPLALKKLLDAELLETLAGNSTADAQLPR